MKRLDLARRFTSSYDAAVYFLQSESIEGVDVAEDEGYACWEGNNGYVHLVLESDGKWALDEGMSNFDDPHEHIEPEGEWFSGDW